MGLFSGLGNLLGIGSASGQAKRGMRNAMWNPGSIGFGGFSVNAVKTNGNRGPVNYFGNLDATQRNLRSGYAGLASQGLANLLTNQGASNLDMPAEFALSNGVGLPEQFYDPENFRAITSAAGSLGQSAIADAQGLLEGGSQGAYDKYLQLLRDSSAEQDRRFMQGGMDSQFLNGILASTAGQYQTQGMMDSLSNADLQKQLAAFGVSQDALNNAFNRAGLAQGMFQSMEGDGANRGFLVNQLAGDRASERFARAMQMFGMDQSKFTQDLQRLAAGSGGMQAQDSMLQSLIGLQGNLAAQRSSANAGAANILNSYNMNNENIWGNILGAGIGKSG